MGCEVTIWVVESAITTMHAVSDKRKDFEKFIYAEIKSMMKSKGMQGGLLMRYNGEPPTYLTVTFWDSRSDWYTFMQNSKMRGRMRRYLVKNPRTRWYQTLARAQGKEFKHVTG